MKVKVSNLQGTGLDWAVAKCEGFLCDYQYNGALVSYSTDWAQGGPIIEREHINLISTAVYPWRATVYMGGGVWINRESPTPLVAAMRCYVASRLGDEVEIPEELL